MRRVVFSEHRVPRSVGVHSGPFHADEVTTCAFLILFDMIDIDKIYRTRDPYILGRCEYICDVGEEYDPDRKIFDHHQNDYNGDLSSAGMILDYLLKTGVVSTGEYKYYRDSFVLGVDAHDNGIELQEKGVLSFSHIIANYNPIDVGASHEERDVNFRHALKFTLEIIKIMQSKYKYIEKCNDIVKQHMSSAGEYIMFDEPVVWQDSFFHLGGENHQAKFIIMPCSDGHWKLRGIPPSFSDRMSVRVPMPAEWAGLSGDALVKISGIEGAVFCHKGCFVSIWETKEAALQALKYILGDL